MAIATLTRLLLIALCDLLRQLTCPLVIGATAHTMFGPGTLTSMITFACFVWGATAFTRWWNSSNRDLSVTAHPPPRIVYVMPAR